MVSYTSFAYAACVRGVECALEDEKKIKTLLEPAVSKELSSIILDYYNILGEHENLHKNEKENNNREIAENDNDRTKTKI